MTVQAVPSSFSLNFLVPDMMCGSCEKKIVAAITALDADAVVMANPETKQVQVMTVQSNAAIRSAIESVGFEVTP